MEESSIKVRFMSLGADFKSVRDEEFASLKDATLAVEEHARSVPGFTNVKLVHGDDGYSVRWTARTPGGRAGRNIAFGDF